jgi:hypothetical protein
MYSMDGNWSTWGGAEVDENIYNILSLDLRFSFNPTNGLVTELRTGKMYVSPYHIWFLGRRGSSSE